MKLGILYTAFAIEDLVEKSLDPWINYHDNQNQIIISTNSCPFAHFPQQDNTKTLELLNKYKNENKIDSLFTSNNPVQEFEARNMSLRRLLEIGVDAMLILDADEIVEQKDIVGLVDFLYEEKQSNSENIWYRANYRNLIFNNNSFVDNFDPARLFWANKNYLQLSHFYSDNDIYYYYIGDLIPYWKLTNTHIPKSRFWPLHHSWNDLERSKNKLQYQQSRGWTTSLLYNKEKNCLEWNAEWFKKFNQSIPEIYKL